MPDDARISAQTWAVSCSRGGVFTARSQVLQEVPEADLREVELINCLLGDFLTTLNLLDLQSFLIFILL